LRKWVIRKEELAPEIKNLSLIPETNAVTYLPIFMAHVTSGKASLEELDVPLPLLKFAIRLISDFELTNWYRPTHAMMVAHLLANDK
jgi:hypothetical protein